MKNLTLTILFAFGASVSLPHSAVASPQTAVSSPGSAVGTPPPEIIVDEYHYSDAELDSLLAPIALYPDTLLTHILIAATYPLDVIAADRWRQSNQHLTPEQVEQALAPVTWDPSVKAIAAFTEVLHTMADDLTWLQQLGDNVLISEARVLARVQALRQHALNTGNLRANDYLEIEREQDVILIAPKRREVVYVPYYDPYVVYGHWSHAIAPVHWHPRTSYYHHGAFYWAPQIRLSSFFYFGAIHWHNRHVVIHRAPVKHYYRGKPAKRVYSKGYQRWQHNVEHRRARYANHVARSAPVKYSRQRVIQSKTKRAHDYTNSERTHVPKTASSVRHKNATVNVPKARVHAKGNSNRELVKARTQAKSVSSANTTQHKKVTRDKPVKRDNSSALKRSGKAQSGASYRVNKPQSAQRKAYTQKQRNTGARNADK